jgi:undecaprenyl-diphosphatase
VRRTAAILGCSGALIFAFTLAVGFLVVGQHGGGPIQGSDVDAWRWFVHHRGPLAGVSKFIATCLDAFPLAVLTIAISAAWFLRTRAITAALPLIAYLGGETLVFAVREIIHRHRPSTAIYPHTGAMPGIYETGYSFPSGHAVAVTAVLFAVAGYIALTSGTRWPYPIALVASLFVAETRLVLGVHWLSDVVFGVLAGVAWGLTVAFAFGRNSAQVASSTGSRTS